MRQYAEGRAFGWHRPGTVNRESEGRSLRLPRSALKADRRSAAGRQRPPSLRLTPHVRGRTTTSAPAPLTPPADQHPGRRRRRAFEFHLTPHASHLTFEVASPSAPRRR